MAKIAAESRELFNSKVKPYKELIQKSFDKEKNMRTLLSKDTSGVAYKKIILCEEMIYISSLYMVINNLSVTLLDTKNNDSLNEARKILYKAVIYLEEIVGNLVDAPYSEYAEKVDELANVPLEKRYFLTRKLGLAIRLLIDAFGDNTKWRWSFVELQGRFATVSKNLIDMKYAVKTYVDPRSPDFDNTIYYLRLVKKLLNESATNYQNRYELSTKRIDDINLAINYLLALRRIHILLNEKDEAEELKKKILVWKNKMESDQKAGISN